MPLPQSDETPGQRLAPIAANAASPDRTGQKTGLLQALVSDYERGKLRLNADMILRFATALEVSTDALLQPAGPVESRSPAARCCAVWN